MLQPSFHLSILEKFLETFMEASEVMVDKLNMAPKELNITHFVNNCVMDILNGKSYPTQRGLRIFLKLIIEYQLPESVLGVSVTNKDKSVNMDDSPFRQ